MYIYRVVSIKKMGILCLLFRLYLNKTIQKHEHYCFTELYCKLTNQCLHKNVDKTCE